MVPTLPTEIIHLIIENLRTDLEEHTLASCSLVCQSWRPFVQPLLFQYVRLCVTKPLDEFLAFLKASPLLAAAIRVLNIWANIHPTTMVIDAESGKCRLSPVLLLQVAANLPLSAELQLQGITLIGWPDNIPLPRTPVRLHRLKLDFLTFRPFACPQCISYDLFSFFELDELDVADSHTDEFINPTAALAAALPAETRPIARSLEIIGVDAFVVRNLLYGGFHPDHLATVRFFPTDGESLGLAGLILRTQGAGVLNIELCISHIINFEGPQDATFWDVFSISSCTRLETLHLSCRHLIPRVQETQGHDSVCAAYLAVLASTPRTLAALTFDLPHTNTAEALSCVMRHLVPPIEQAVARFPGLRTLTLVVTRSFTADECMRVMRSTLPGRIMDGRILRFEYKDVHF